MKNVEISFRPIGNSGPLAIYWHAGPYGNAVECKEGNGISWQTANGELLGVEFDDVTAKTDHQIMTTPGGITIEIVVKNRKVRWSIRKAHQTKSFSKNQREVTA